MGGGTRIPAVRQLISQVLNTENLNVQMQSESISRGCALLSAQFAALINPMIMVEKLEV